MGCSNSSAKVLPAQPVLSSGREEGKSAKNNFKVTVIEGLTIMKVRPPPRQNISSLEMLNSKKRSNVENLEPLLLRGTKSNFEDQWRENPNFGQSFKKNISTNNLLSSPSRNPIQLNGGELRTPTKALREDGSISKSNLLDGASLIPNSPFTRKVSRGPKAPGSPIRESFKHFSGKIRELKNQSSPRKSLMNKVNGISRFDPTPRRKGVEYGFYGTPVAGGRRRLGSDTNILDQLRDSKALVKNKPTTPLATKSSKSNILRLKQIKEVREKLKSPEPVPFCRKHKTMGQEPVNDLQSMNQAVVSPTLRKSNVISPSNRLNSFNESQPSRVLQNPAPQEQIEIVESPKAEVRKSPSKNKPVTPVQSPTRVLDMEIFFQPTENDESLNSKEESMMKVSPLHQKSKSSFKEPRLIEESISNALSPAREQPRDSNARSKSLNSD